MGAVVWVMSAMVWGVCGVLVWIMDPAPHIMGCRMHDDNGMGFAVGVRGLQRRVWSADYSMWGLWRVWYVVCGV